LTGENGVREETEEGGKVMVDVDGGEKPQGFGEYIT